MYLNYLLLLLVAEEEEIYRLADIQAKNMPLSVVRLSFRAYLLDGTRVIQVLPAVMSNPIYDSSMQIILYFCICNLFFLQQPYVHKKKSVSFVMLWFASMCSQK